MKAVKILYLYPNDMNFYGDSGNVIAIKQRLSWRGIASDVIYHNVGENFNYRPDIVIGGGGQDSGQLKIHNDLLSIGPELHKLADQGVPMLVVCGIYQLFGKRFVTNSDEELKGIGIFDLETIAKPKRLVSNIRIETQYGELIGFENHSGQTYLKNQQKSFGSVLNGFGNNDDCEEEGAILNNVIGTYMHGPLLPRNPWLADSLLSKVFERLDQPLPSLASSYNNLAQSSQKQALKRLFN